MVDRPRYLIALGDRDPEPVTGLRLVSLTFPEATLAAVRYVQVPRWKELGVLASQVSLSVGSADIFATLGDPSLAALAYPGFCEHARALARELSHLTEPQAPLLLRESALPIEWEWAHRFREGLAQILETQVSSAHDTR